MSPDWSATPVAIPYANMANPQSLNLYGYISNDPITGEDADGHFRVNTSCFETSGCDAEQPPAEVPEPDANEGTERQTDEQKEEQIYSQTPMAQENVQSPEAAAREKDLIESAVGQDPTEKMAVKAIAEEAGKSAGTPSAAPTVAQPNSGGQIMVGPSGTAVVVKPGQVAEPAANGNGTVIRAPATTGNVT